MKKTALITGISGQDGAYLAHHLLHLGYRVIGSSRDAQTCNLERLERLGIKNKVTVISIALNDFRSVLKAISEHLPDEVYNLAGQTSVSLSFDLPVECLESISMATLNILEVIRYLKRPIRYFNAGSSECYGNIGSEPATEETAFSPRSPYAVAKAAAYWQVSTYREAYRIHACTGILANHESPLRPSRFVTQKIISTVKAIKKGSKSTLTLGNLDIWRDWGWAPDYAKAMHLMLQTDEPRDFIIASGRTTSLMNFANHAFRIAGLCINDHLESVEELKRPSDLDYSSLDPALIKKCLAWETSKSIEDIVRKMYEDELF